jgi:hypothetical protein
VDAQPDIAISVDNVNKAMMNFSFFTFFTTVPDEMLGEALSETRYSQFGALIRLLSASRGRNFVVYRTVSMFQIAMLISLV